MKHVELINRIIEVEHEARQLAEEARAKKEHLAEDLRSDAKAMRDNYFEQARSRIKKVHDRENSATDVRIEALRELNRQQSEDMERLFSENKLEWVDKLFGMVVGR